MYRHYVQEDTMYQRVCLGQYIQMLCTDAMYGHYVQTVCTDAIYVRDTMNRTSCTGHHVQDTMYRHYV